MATLPIQASFMGIPAELRLHIYSHLLTPSLTDADIDQLGTHNCGKYTSRWLPACECDTKHLHPQILATNSQIFKEAMPILYGNLWFIVELDSLLGLRYYPYPLNKIPNYAIPYIARLVITGYQGDFELRGNTYKWPDYLRSDSHMQQHLRPLCLTFPGLRHIRLVIYGQDLVRDSDSERVRRLAAFARLPGLRTVAIHVVQEEGFLRDLTAFIKDVIEDASKDLSRELVVYEADSFGRKLEQVSSASRAVA